MKRLSAALFIAGASMAIAFGGNGDGVAFQKYRWENVEIVGGGFVSGILYHPKQENLIYARTDIGGAYRWDPKTKRWVQLLDWIQRPDWNLYGVESIGLDPTDPKRLYLALGTYTNSWAGNGAILRSTDQGRTFQRTDLPFKLGGNMDGRSIGERLAVDPNKTSVLYFGSRGNGLWKSSDFGATWSQQAQFPVNSTPDGVGVCFEVFDSSSGRKGQPTPIIYAGVASSKVGLYRSTDSGATWSPVPGQPAGLIPHHAAFDSEGSLILTYANGPGPNGLTAGAVWKLSPKMGRWTDISPIPGKGFGYAGLSLDPQHPGMIVVTSLDRWSSGDDVFRTIDGGQHWMSMKDTAKLDSSGSPFLNWGQKVPRFGWWMGTVAMDPFNPATIMFGTGATIWGCNDAGNVDSNQATHWTVRAQGLEETAVIDLISPTQGAHLFSALGDIGGFRHEDLRVVPPEGMSSNPLFGNTDSIDFAESNPMIIVRVGRAGEGVRRGGYSMDGGKNWSPFATEPQGSRGSGHVAISADGSTIIWTPIGQKPSLTRDNGASWTSCNGAPIGTLVFADRVNSRKFYGLYGRQGEFYISEDGGATFKIQSKGLPTGEVVRPVPEREGELWLVAGKSLYHSTNSGQTFIKLASIVDVGTIGFGKSAPGAQRQTLYAIGEVSGRPGAFRSDDDGADWVCITDAQHGFGTMDQIIGDPRIYGRVYIGTNGRGVLFGDPVKN